MYDQFFSVALTFFLVIDALGNLPVFVYLLKKYGKKTQLKITLREVFFALVIMVLFHFLGKWLLTLLDISKQTVQIGGGIVLFLIAIRLIFSNDDHKEMWKETKPFIVPIATPIIAGPSLLAVIMIFAQEIESDFMVIGAILVAWFASALIFLLAGPLYRLVGEKVLMACQRLMGLIVALIAVQLFVQGIGGVFKQ